MGKSNLPAVKSKPPTVIDTRLKISDPALCAYINTQRKIGTREVNQQIIHMLKFAASQMSAHDMEKEPVNG